MRRLLALVALILTVTTTTAQQGGMGPGPGVKSYGAPADFVNDTFTDSAVTLAGHTGETGATWTRHTSFTDTISIQSNRAGKDSGTLTTVYWASGTPPSVNYTIQGDVIDIGDVARANGICGWIDTTADTMICARRQNQTTWQFIKFVTGTGTAVTMTTGANTVTTSFSAGVSTALKVVRTTGNSFEWFVGGTSRGTATIADAEFASSGRVGIRASNNHSGTGFHTDNLRAF